MDESQPTTCNTENAEPTSACWGMPRIEMPADATTNDSGYVAFELGTAEGPVHVQSYWKDWECRGTVAALVAGGLLRPEWCPGLPGNNKTRQQILFDSDGPRLLVGNTRGKKQTGARITVCRISARSFMVEVPATIEQQQRLEAFHERRAARHDAEMKKWRLVEYEKQREEDRINRWKSETEKGVRLELAGLMSSAKNICASRLSDSRFRYADEVVAQVNQYIEAAKQALLAGKMLPASSQYQRDGNVVYLPRASS